MFVTIGRKRLMLVAAVLAVFLWSAPYLSRSVRVRWKASVSDWGLSFQEEGKHR